MHSIHLIPSFVCLIMAIVSIPLMYLPVTETEKILWQKLHLRLLRQWVKKRGTEKWAYKGTIQNVIERSRKNIAWHGIMTFTFFFLMIRAQFVDDVLIRYASYFFLLPSMSYFIGSIIQRQKLVIILLRKQKRQQVVGASR
jgi:hypothetical protein